MGQKFLKSIYRREPITSFIMTMALVELVIGSFEQEWLLLGLSGTMALGSLILRYRQGRRSISPEFPPHPEYYLPPAAPRPVLPRLTDKTP